MERYRLIIPRITLALDISNRVLSNPSASQQDNMAIILESKLELERKLDLEISGIGKCIAEFLKDDSFNAKDVLNRIGIIEPRVVWGEEIGYITLGEGNRTIRIQDLDSRYLGYPKFSEASDYTIKDGNSLYRKILEGEEVTSVDCTNILGETVSLPVTIHHNKIYKVELRLKPLDSVNYFILEYGRAKALVKPKMMDEVTEVTTVRILKEGDEFYVAKL